MANTLQLKRSSTASAVPLLGDLSIAELAFNTNDSALFISDGTSVVQLNHSDTISTSSSNRFVSDSQVTAWDAKLPLAGGTVTGKVVLTEGTDVSLVTDGALTIGATSGANLAFDSNEIQARNNGTFGNLNLNIEGGTVLIGNAGSTVVVNGSLTVNGTTTTVNTETINLADNIITLNSNETGAPTQDGGIEVERGTSTNSRLFWDETAEVWKVDIAGVTNVIIHGGSIIDADTLDGIDSTSFLRSDVNGTLSGRLTLSSDWPELSFNETNAGTDSKNWRMIVDSALLRFQTQPDDYSTSAELLTLNRAGDLTLSGKLSVGTATYGSYNSTNEPTITALVGGSGFGGLIESPSNGHLVIGLRSNDDNDSFSIISDSGAGWDGTYDNVVTRIYRDGNVDMGLTGTTVTLAGSLDVLQGAVISGSLDVQTNLVVRGEGLFNNAPLFVDNGIDTGTKLRVVTDNTRAYLQAYQRNDSNIPKEFLFSGYGGNDIGEFRVKSSGDFQDIFHEDNVQNRLASRTWAIKTSAYTAVASDFIAVDTTSSAITITLPAAPSIGDTVGILDAASNASTNNVTVARNGKLIMGSAADLTVNIDNDKFELVFINDTLGWRKF